MAENEKAARPRAARPRRAENTPADMGTAGSKAARSNAATGKASSTNPADTRAARTRALNDKAAEIEVVRARTAGTKIARVRPGDDRAAPIDAAIDEADRDKIDAIVSPRTDDPTARIVAGARVRSCAQCLADVFVAPSTFAYFKGREMPPIWCVQCAMLAAETHGTSSRAGRA